jgi:transcriptional regulator GlxA family with amidase domain
MPADASVATASHKIRAALDFVRERSSDPSLDLEGTAAEVRLSPFHLSRLLKRQTGFGFAHHLRLIRVRHAEQLLRSSRLSVKEVAGSVGYSNTNALDRNFRTVLGMTPTIYRQLIPAQEVVTNRKISTRIGLAATE